MSHREYDNDNSQSLENSPRRPIAGPRRPREIWTGRSEVWLSEVSADPAEPMRNMAGGGLRVSNRMLSQVLERERRRKQARSIGVDAARGFALIGMFAVHMLPAFSDGRATVTWMLLAGNAASLFAVLAGVSFSFNSGAERPSRGRALVRARANIVVRAILLIILGVGINELDLAAYDILPYFGVMFFLILPFVSLRARSLFAIGTSMILIMPIVRYLLHRLIVEMGWHPNPTVSTIFADPLGVFATLSVTGIYPALTWVGLICIGMGVGRLSLQHTNPRLLLIVAGALAVFFAVAVSTLIVDRFNGYQAIVNAMPARTEDSADDFMVFGPTGPLPTGSPGWLLASGPHTNTPFALTLGAGFSLLCIGFFILVARWPKLLSPLVDMGRMPMTLYISHLIFFTVVPENINPLWIFLVQIFLAVGFASLWFMFARRGPIEAIVTFTTRLALRGLGLGNVTKNQVSRSRG